MKPRFSNQRDHALTLVEVLLVIAILAVLVMVLLPAIVSTGHNGAQEIGCVNNLKEIVLACHVWTEDYNDKYPMEISVTNGGSMELAAAGNVVATFLSMSNELSTPKLLICPEDKKRFPAATSFFDPQLKGKISYFVGIDVTLRSNSQMIFSGDDNFTVDDILVKSGLVQFSTNANVAWTSGRHVSAAAHFWTPTRDKIFGNLAMADGSVQQVSQNGLRQAVQQTGVATNRLAIP